MSDSTDSTTPQAEHSPKSAKHSRTMLVTVIIAFLGFVLLIALNMN
jgi:hypothetical protein